MAAQPAHRVQPRHAPVAGHHCRAFGKLAGLASRCRANVQHRRARRICQKLGHALGVDVLEDERVAGCLAGGRHAPLLETIGAGQIRRPCRQPRTLQAGKHFSRVCRRAQPEVRRGLPQVGLQQGLAGAGIERILPTSQQPAGMAQARGFGCWRNRGQVAQDRVYQSRGRPLACLPH